MGKQIAHLFADAGGATHFATVDLRTDPAPGGPVALFSIPVTHMTYAEYPDEVSEIMPGLHPAPARQFVMSVAGSFRVTATDGESREFHPGDWVLFDDVGSRGHTTEGLPGPSRVNLVVAVADDWIVPPAG